MVKWEELGMEEDWMDVWIMMENFMFSIVQKVLLGNVTFLICYFLTTNSCSTVKKKKRNLDIVGVKWVILYLGAPF